MRKKFFTFISLLAVLTGISVGFGPLKIQAESYSLYVDEDYDGDDSDGSKDDPFENIEDALDEADSSDKIYIKNGSYEGGFTVPKGVGLYGESKSGVVIVGGITAKDDVHFENLTISGGSYGVVVEAGASVEFESCIVENSGGIGINILAGNGKLKVTDTKIKGNGKGFYIQKGNRIEISNSYVYNNGEEGIDIRNNIDGFIKNCQIYENDESGIEVILGNAIMEISGNLIEKNGASGIASQFYQDYDDLGEVEVKNNKIRKNHNYGIDCKVPQAGNPSRTYWKESLDLIGNEFSDNEKKDINSSCKITFEVDEDESETEEAAKEESDQAEEKVVKVSEVSQEEKNRQKELELLEKFQTDVVILENKISQSGQSLDLEIEQVESQGKWSYLFRGPNEESLTKIENLLTEENENIISIQEMIEQASDQGFKQENQQKVEQFQQQLNLRQEFLTQQKNRDSFWKRLKSFFS